MARRRRIYTPEFKAEAVKLVTEQGYAIVEAARSLGLNENLIRNWKQALQDNGQQAFPGRGKLSAFEAWGDEGDFADEPDFPAALAFYREAIQHAKTQTDSLRRSKPSWTSGTAIAHLELQLELPATPLAAPRREPASRLPES